MLAIASPRAPAKRGAIPATVVATNSCQDVLQEGNSGGKTTYRCNYFSVLYFDCYGYRTKDSNHTSLKTHQANPVAKFRIANVDQDACHLGHVRNRRPHVLPVGLFVVVWSKIALDTSVDNFQNQHRNSTCLGVGNA